MSQGMRKCQKFGQIVGIRQMLKQWRWNAPMKVDKINTNEHTPTDVPTGHVAVIVGIGMRRFIVRATYLNYPMFRNLLVQTEEEYGFNNDGPLTIPCDESLFEEILRVISRSDSSSNSGRFSRFEVFQRFCHVGMKNKLGVLSESRPLLHGIADKPVY